jgi:hypothetical protein
MKRRARPHLSKVDRINISKKVCQLYVEDIYTIASCCEAWGIMYCTFQSWAQPQLTDKQINSKEYRKGFIHEVHELYKSALKRRKQNFRRMLLDAAYEGMLKNVRGCTYNEISTNIIIGDNGKVKSHITTTRTRVILPSTTMLIYLAQNFKICETK